jgi:hypothetical protein
VASSVVTTYAPVTSIEVDANSLFERVGCGLESGQAYKYVVVAYQAGEEGLPTSGAQAVTVSDCYTDALFQNLSNSQLVGAVTFFSLRVFVFDQATYDALDAQDHLDSLGPADFPDDDDGGGDSPGDHIAQDALYTTTCFAQQLPNVESIAACDALQD